METLVQQLRAQGTGYAYLDLKVLAEQTGHDEAIQQALLDDFCKIFPDLLLKAQSAVNQKDKEKIRYYLHQLKGTIGIFSGGVLFSEVSHAVEVMPQANERQMLLLSYLVIKKAEVLLKEVLHYQNEMESSQKGKAL